MNGRILVIEDEIKIQESLKHFLEGVGYQVDVADDGVEGAHRAGEIAYALILLDVMLPKIDGYAVLEMIRKTSDVPVIMLTAMGQEENQIRAFDLQADDYIVKPFTMNILLRRIRALLRRSNKTLDVVKERVLVHGNLTIDENSFEVRLNNQPILLTSREFDLLKELVGHPGRLFTRDELLRKFWGEDFFGEDYLVNVHIGNLRKKLGGEYICTVRGKGYKFVDEN